MFLNKFLFCIRNICFNIFNRVFTRKNMYKIGLIFIVGFTSRIGINYLLGINVFVDYLNIVSLVYYGFMSCFSGVVYNLTEIGYADISFIIRTFTYFLILILIMKGIKNCF